MQAFVSYDQLKPDKSERDGCTYTLFQAKLFELADPFLECRF